MFKMMKYEFRKSLMPILIILGLTVVAEIVYLIGLGTAEGFDDGLTMSIGVFCLFMMGMVSYIYLLINGEVMFERDLKNKEGYLVFMAPISMYAVIGAKLLMVFIETAIFTVGYALLGLTDIYLLLRRFDLKVDELMQGLKRAGFAISIHKNELVLAAIAIFVAIFMIYTFSYLATSLTRIIFREKNAFSNLITFVIFIALAIATSKLTALVYSGASTNGVEIFIGNPAMTASRIDSFGIVVGIVMDAVFSLCAYISTAWILKRKIDL